MCLNGGRIYVFVCPQASAIKAQGCNFSRSSLTTYNVEHRRLTEDPVFISHIAMVQTRRGKKGGRGMSRHVILKSKDYKTIRYKMSQSANKLPFSNHLPVQFESVKMGTMRSTK